MPTTIWEPSPTPGPLARASPTERREGQGRSLVGQQPGANGRTEFRHMAIDQKTTEVRRRVVSTGSTEIDKKMGGGIPEGSLILIEGSSNAGKSVVTQQLTYGALNSGFRCVALHDREHAAQPLPPDGEPEPGRHGLLPARRAQRVPGARGHDAGSGRAPRSTRCSTHLGRLQGKFDIIFIDSLTSFVSQVREAQTLTFLTRQGVRRPEHDDLLHHALARVRRGDVHAHALAVRCAPAAAHRGDGRPAR